MTLDYISKNKNLWDEKANKNKNQLIVKRMI